jgi:hypothetical protein
MEKAESLSFPTVIRSGGRGQSLHNEILIGAKPFKLSLPYFSPDVWQKICDFCPQIVVPYLAWTLREYDLPSQKTHPQTMADTMETARNEGIRALSPLQRVAPVVHMPDEGDGQNRPSASDVSAIGASTTPTPPRRILVQAVSVISSITNAATSSSGNTANGDGANDTPRKQRGGSSRNSSSVA